MEKKRFRSLIATINLFLRRVRVYTSSSPIRGFLSIIFQSIVIAIIITSPLIFLATFVSDKLDSTPTEAELKFVVIE